MRSYRSSRSNLVQDGWTFITRQHSRSLIYSFTCVCGLQYIGKTNQCLDSRIKQHVPTKIRQRNYFADWINNTYWSSIVEHLINNHNCASSYSVDLFTILSKFYSDYHLKILETIHIHIHKPSLPVFLLNHCPHFNCDQRGLKLVVLFFFF